MTDHELAARLATEAGRLLLAVRDELANASSGERKAAGDKRSHDFLMEALAAERPGDAVLSEEGVDDSVRLSADRVWIVDPLDGTREFSELGRTDWAVHVALWQTGELAAGAVALPAQAITLATPSVPAPPAAPSAPRIVVSRTRPPAIALNVRDRLGALSSKWALQEPKPRRSCRDSPTCTSTRADSTSGTTLLRWRWRAPPVCMPRASTARRWNTTDATRCCPIC